jgi:hypothetical protein
MKNTFFLSLILSATSVAAQSNLSIFNNNGQQFYVVLNGIRQNSKPETNVQVGQIKNGSYAVKVIFADGKTPDIDKNFMIDAPYDITTRIIFKKGQGKLQLMSMEPTHGAIQEAVVYRPTDAAVYSDAIVVNTIPSPNTTVIQTNTNTNNNNTVNGTVQTSGSSNINVQTTGVNTNAAGVNMNMNVQETTTTTTTTGTIPDENVNLNMNLSVGGVNVNMNANASGTGLGVGTTVSETTTTTTTSSSTTVSSSNSSTTSGVGLNSNININQSGANQSVQGQTNTQVLQQQQQVIQNQQLGRIVNCTQTMNRLEAFKAELQDQSFEDDRLEALKLGLNKTCLTTAQAAQLLDLFSFDENRLEAAKYLSDRLTDRASAGELAKKLTFDSSKMEYRRYISE